MGKIIVATGFEKLPKVQLIAQSGDTGRGQTHEASTSVNYKSRAVNISNLLIIKTLES